jgi:hypothetical protein
MSDPDLRYPIGRFQRPDRPSEAERAARVDEVASLPAALRAGVAGLEDPQLESPYRPGGWTVRQVVHHLADSHLNAYVRLRLALTENVPEIRTYREERWAELLDARSAPLCLSLDLIDSLHARWVMLLRSLTPADAARTLRHPEIGTLSIDQLTALYAWHGRHHLTHITSLRERQGW